MTEGIDVNGILYLVIPLVVTAAVDIAKRYFYKKIDEAEQSEEEDSEEDA